MVLETSRQVWTLDEACILHRESRGNMHSMSLPYHNRTVVRGVFITQRFSKSDLSEAVLRIFPRRRAEEPDWALCHPLALTMLFVRAAEAYR